MDDRPALLGGGRWLLALAAPAEFGAGVNAGLTRDRVPLLTGVGKANAAAAVAHTLAVASREGPFAGVVSLGIAGSLDETVAVGDTVIASRALFADEGAERPGGWQTTADFGFPLITDPDGHRHATDDGMGIEADGPLGRELSTRLLVGGGSLHTGVIATVSVCSGTDERRRMIRARVDAIAEAMEGAAVGLAAHRFSPALRFLELRTISNRTGDEPAWDAPLALDRLASIARQL